MFLLRSSSTNSTSRLLTATIFSYFGLLKDPDDPDTTIDPDNVWLDLCLNDDSTKARCVAFLKAYVKDSEQEFPILVPLEETGEEPQETKGRRTVTSAHSLLNIWRSLIAEADATVLLKKRREDPAKKNIWRLKFMDHTNKLGQGPVYEISKVSQKIPLRCHYQSSFLSETTCQAPLLSSPPPGSLTSHVISSHANLLLVHAILDHCC
jgi:hypothetical protein